MLSFSEEMEVRVVIGEDFAPRALLPRVSFQDLVRRGGLVGAYKRKGMHARARKPARVAMGGELPKLISRVLGQ
jgi:hypothetical protein